MKPVNGYFFGLNDQTKEEAFKAFQDDAIDPYPTKELCLADAEKQRVEGMFADDNATVQVFHVEIKLTEVI